MNNPLILTVNELLDLSFDLGLLYYGNNYHNIPCFHDFYRDRISGKDFVYLSEYKKYLKRFKVISTKKLKHLLKTKQAFWSKKHNNCLVVVTDNAIYPISVSKHTLKTWDYIKFKEVRQWFLERG